MTGAEFTIAPGVIFDTCFESGCIVISELDELNTFEAIDSEGVLCSYDTQMVVGHPDFKAPFGYDDDGRKVEVD